MSVSSDCRNGKSDNHANGSNQNAEDRKETPPICNPTWSDSTAGNVCDEK